MGSSSTPSQEQIKQAGLALSDNKLVAMPTETVYGLAARIDRPAALKKVFQIKDRPSFDPLIVHVRNVKQAQSLAASWPKTADILTKAFWPGPLTVVVPKNLSVSDIISAGLQTVGIRMPNHPTALALLNECLVPLAAPSANRFGRTSPTLAQHVQNEFPEAIQKGEIVVLDGGACAVGVESTVALCEDEYVTVLRPGGISKAELEFALRHSGLPIPVKMPSKNKNSASPGHTDHHYMPEKPLTVFWGSSAAIKQHRLEAQDRYHEIILAGDSRLAARELYALMRSADLESTKLNLILYRDSNQQDLWEAIDDRLLRAASFRLGNPPNL
jgi:L-threonylcarbamoyladenylate synthase